MGICESKDYETVLDIMREFPTADAYLIDMAIGLPECIEESEKRPDKATREELGKNGSTVFPIPCRQAVMVDPNDPQTVIKLRELYLAVLGKSLSAQSINIIPKIRELNEFLDDYREYKNVLCESHPELCFTRLNGKALMMNKKTAEGLEERQSILEKYIEKGMMDGIQVRARELNCMPDDIMDSVCLAVSAALKAHGMCETIPEEPETDVRGLVMQMIVPK